MNNVFVYCEIEGTQVQEVSQELLTKGRKLANELKVELHAIVAGTGMRIRFCLTALISCLFSTVRTCSLTPQLPTPTFWLTSSRRSSHRSA